MAWVQCPECKKMVSDKSDKCMSCGCGINYINSFYAKNTEELLKRKSQEEKAYNDRINSIDEDSKNIDRIVEENIAKLKVQLEEEKSEFNKTRQLKLMKIKEEMGENIKVLYKKTKKELEEKQNEIKELYSKKFDAPDVDAAKAVQEIINNESIKEDELLRRCRQLEEAMSDQDSFLKNSEKNIDDEEKNIEKKYQNLIRKEYEKLNVSSEEVKQSVFSELISEKNVMSEILYVLGKIGMCAEEKLKDYSFVISKSINNTFEKSVRNLLAWKKITRFDTTGELYIATASEQNNASQNTTSQYDTLPHNQYTYAANKNDYEVAFSGETGSEGGFIHRLYDDIGNKIKNWAVWIFIIEAIFALLCGVMIILMAEDAVIAIVGLLVMIIGPVVAYVSSWLLYGFGELIDKTSKIEEKLK